MKSSSELRGVPGWTKLAEHDGAPPPADASGGGGDVVRWELVPPRYGSGSWLIAIDAALIRVWAPPGVALSGSREEPLERWTGAQVRALDDDVEDDLIVTMTLFDVLADVPADYEQWAIGCTADQVRMLALYVRTRSGAPADRRVAAARALREELVSELDAHARRPRRVPARPKPASEDAANPFALLSDHEFTEIATELLEADLGVAPSCQSIEEGACGGLVYDEPAGPRHVFLMRHWSSRCAVEDAEQSARRLRRDRSAADVYWYVTSQALASRVRRDLIHAVVTWGGERTHVVDRTHLERVMDHHPDVAQERIKLRIASAANRGLLGGALRHAQPDFERLVETRVLQRAREALRERGTVLLHGAAGVGKTTIARCLAADAALNGYEPVEVGAVREALAVLGSRQPHVVVWDGAADGAGLHDVVDRARHSDTALTIVVTPHHAAKSEADVIAIGVGDYDRNERALMVYNHVWHAQRRGRHDLPAAYERDLLHAVIEHPHFTPRLAATLASCDYLELGSFRTLVPPSHDRRHDPGVDRLFARLREDEPWCLA